MPLKPTGPRSGRRRGPPYALPLLAAALALPSALAGTASLPEGKGGIVELRLDAALPDTADLYLRPGGPYAREQIDLGADARDVVLSGDLLLVAGGDDGLLVLRLEADRPPSPLARLPLSEPALTVAAQHGIAWLTGPLGLTAVDLSDPATPRVRGRYASSRPLGFALSGERGYLLLERELHVLDLASPEHPSLSERLAFGFEATAFALGEDGLYIAAGDMGLLIYEPQAPGAGLRGFRGGAPVLDVALDGGRAYLANGADGITVVDRDAGGEPRWRGSLRGAAGVVTRLSVRDGRALVRTEAGRLYLADVENPQAMELLAVLQPDGCCEAQRFAGDGALVLAGGRLIGYELAPPPRRSNEGLAAGQGVNFGGQRRVYIEGATAYVADWFSGLHIYDLTAPSRPVLLSSFHTGGSPKGVVVRADIAYVADDDHGLLILDVADPRRPRELARLPTPGLAYTPVLDGDRLYLAVHHGGVVAVDVSEPRAPALLAHYDTPGKAWSLRVQDGLAYVADDDAGLLILDVRDPVRPRPLGRYEPGGQMEEVLIDGRLAYLALYGDGVHVVDVGDPGAPVLLARVPTPGNARGLALRDGLLYVADWLAGVQIVDVSDPERPGILGMRDTDGAAWGLALHGDTAFVADWWGGISVLDIGDPGRPAPLGGYPRRERVEGVAAVDGFAYVAQGDAGLQVFDIGNPLNPTWITGVDLGGARDVLLQGDLAWVLHDKGRRLAAVDVSDPFRAHPVRELALAHEAHALRAAAGAVLAIGERAYTLADASAEPRAYALEGIVDAWAVAGRTLLAMRDGRVLALAQDGAPGRVVADLAGTSVRRAAADRARAAMYVEGEGLRIMEWTDGTAGGPGLREAARIPFADPVDALRLDGDRLYAASGRRLLTIDVAAPAQWRAADTYEAMEDITGIAVHEDTVYLAGAASLRALEPLPEAKVEPRAHGTLDIHVPPGLPAGSYDLVATRRTDGIAAAAAPLLRDALRVQPLRLGGPR